MPQPEQNERCTVEVVASYEDDEVERYEVGTHDPQEVDELASSPSGFVQLQLQPLQEYGGVWTHLHAEVTLLGGDVVTSEAVQLQEPVPLNEAPQLRVWQWSGNQGGYKTYSAYMDPGRRAYLKGGVCPGRCSWRLVGYTRYGTREVLKANLDQQAEAFGYASTDVRRLAAEVYTHGAPSFSTASPVLAVDPLRNVWNGVDAVGVMAAIQPTVAEGTFACLPLQNVRGPGDSFTTQAYLRCVALVGAGAVSAAVVATLEIEFPGSAAVLQAGNLPVPELDGFGEVFDPPLSVPSDPNPATPPFRAGDVYQPAVRTIELSITGRRLTSAVALTAAEVSVAARECYRRVVPQFSSDPAGVCSRSAIFFPGSDTPEATKHDADAITAHPYWVQLSRGRGPGWTPVWYNASDPCKPLRPTGKHCDEFPFRSTQQGGPGTATQPRADLRLIEGIGDNMLQGTRLGTFYSQCAPSTGDQFLVVPLIAPPAAFTFGVC